MGRLKTKCLGWGWAILLLTASSPGYASRHVLTNIEREMQAAHSSADTGSPIGVKNARREIGKFLTGSGLPDIWSKDLDQLERDAAVNLMRRTIEETQQSATANTLDNIKRAKSYLDTLPAEQRAMWEGVLEKAHQATYSEWEWRQVSHLKDVAERGDELQARIIFDQLSEQAKDARRKLSKKIFDQVTRSHNVAVAMALGEIEKDTTAGWPSYVEKSFARLSELTGQPVSEAFYAGRMSKALAIALGRAISGFGTESEGDGYSDSDEDLEKLKVDLTGRLRKLLPKAQADTVLTRVYQTQLDFFNQLVDEQSGGGDTERFEKIIESIHAMARTSGLKVISKNRGKTVHSKPKKLTRGKY